MSTGPGTTDLAEVVCLHLREEALELAAILEDHWGDFAPEGPTAYSNGRLPSSALGTIPGTSPRPGGKPLLRKDAARAYTALHNYAMKRWGISMALHESWVRRAYRELQAQYAAKRVYGRNAATPGTSNHGLGIAVDLMTRQQRWVVDQVGHLFGWSKRWSDAAWEWWHIKFRPGKYAMVKRASTAPFRPLRYRARGKRVKWVQRRLRVRGFESVPGRGMRGYGFYGKSTVSAVKRVQRAHKLKADGIVGRRTWRELAR